MSLAREETPDLIVLCVEAQPTNGYMLCTRLKKDEQLKSIPIILTSANATPDAFEKHKKLKTRAEDYLIKPFEPKTVVEKAAGLVGLSGGKGAAEEEIVSMEDESIGLGDLVQADDEPISLSEEDVREAHAALEEPAIEEALVVEEVEEVLLDEPIEEPRAAEAPAPEPLEGGDDELSKFDEAFDGIRPADPAPLEKPKLRLAPEPELEPIA